MSTSAFVRAGVKVPAYIEAKEGLYPACFFRYDRPDPKTCERQYKEFREVSNEPDKLIESMQKFVTLRISEWSLDAPCNAENIKLLTHPMLLKIYFIINQSQPTAKIPLEYLEEGETGTPEGELKKF